MQPKDWISVVALIVAAAAFALNLHASWQRRAYARRDMFLTMHDRLIAPEMQEGRAILYSGRIESVEDVGKLRAESPEEYRLVQRALAMMDVLGLYVDNDYVSKRLVLAEHGNPLRSLAAPARHVIEFRDRTIDNFGPTWPHLQELIAAAEAEAGKRASESGSVDSCEEQA